MKRSGYTSMKVSINISAIQLLNKHFVNNLLDIIREMDVNPQQIILELTESIFSSRFETINDILSQLRDNGIQSAIDDFGTGYSSLSRERELVTNYLKIDKSFIDRLLQLKEEETITTDIIAIAHKMGHRAIAEGVEKEEQLYYLKIHGCDMVQGYFISRPLDEDLAISFLETYPKNRNQK
jgi:EAL domain-containing protein (putative c-di-GMP-specific phosphodiesterase class I)